MRRRLVVSYLVLAVVVLLALEVPLAVLGARRERDAVRSNAVRDATVLAAGAFGGFDPDGDHGGPHADLHDLARRYEAGTGAETVVVDRTGKVIAYQANDDSSDRDANGDVGAELRQALRGSGAVASRTDEGHPVETAAEPVTAPDGTVIGAVQVSISASRAQHRIRELDLLLLAFAVLVLALVAAVGVVISRSVVGPLSSLTGAVHALETGDLTARARVEGPPEIRELGSAFNEMASRLDELISSQRNFLADASHQLRSPLTALRLRLEAIDPRDRDATRTHLAGAVDEVGRLSRLVEGLLALVRFDGARPARVRIDVAAVVRDRADLWEPLAAERDVALVLSVPTTPLEALDVAGHLEQILDNVLANALEVAPAGSVIHLEAGLRSFDGRSAAVAVISDAGPGMTREQLETAFDRFWQDETSRTGSAGLGLPISRQLARTSGGDLLLDAAPSGGLRATIRLELDSGS